MLTKRQFCTAGLAVAFTAPALATEAGAMAPALDLPGLKGPVNLAAMKGQVVYVDFWASWCGPCKLSFPFLNEMQARHGAKGFRVVGVNLDAKREDADGFLASTPAQFAVAFDPKGDSARRFAVKAMPSSVLIGRDGKVLVVHRGFKLEDRAEIESHILKAL